MLRLPQLSVIALGILSCRLGYNPTANDSGAGTMDAPVADAGYTIDADPTAMPDAAPRIDCWDSNWSERQRLTFHNTGQTESLQAFPVLVKLDASTIDYQKTQNAGQDLRFVDPDGTTLAHEIETWDEAGDSFVWVQVPQIDGASNTDHIWMHYGNSSVGDGQNSSAVWDADHAGVWHLAETTGAHIDSAAGISCDWAGGGDGTQDAVGRIGGANDFDGADDAAHCGIDQIADTLNSTITAWVNLSLTGDTDQEVVAIEALTGTYDGLSLYIRRTDGAVGRWLRNGYEYGALATSRIVASQWSLIAVRGFQDTSSGSIEVSVNAGPWETVVSGNTGNMKISANTPLVLGRWTGAGPGSATRGRIDEIRVSKIQRSDDWVRAQYLSATNAFVTASDEPQLCP